MSDWISKGCTLWTQVFGHDFLSGASIRGKRLFHLTKSLSTTQQRSFHRRAFLLTVCGFVLKEACPNIHHTTTTVNSTDGRAPIPGTDTCCNGADTRPILIPAALLWPFSVSKIDGNGQKSFSMMLTKIDASTTGLFAISMLLFSIARTHARKLKWLPSREKQNKKIKHLFVVSVKCKK